MLRMHTWSERDDVLGRKRSKGRFNRSQARLVKRELHRLAYS